MNVLTEVLGHVYIGRTNPTVKVGMDTWDPVAKTLTPIDWTGITKLVMTLTRRNDGVVQTIDTSVDAVISFAVAGELTFTLGPLAESRPIASGVYDAELSGVDGASVETIWASMTHPTHRLAFQFHTAVTLT